MPCSACGAANLIGATFCARCGSYLAGQAGSAPPQATAPMSAGRPGPQAPDPSPDGGLTRPATPRSDEPTLPRAAASSYVRVLVIVSVLVLLSVVVFLIWSR